MVILYRQQQKTFLKALLQRKFKNHKIAKADVAGTERGSVRESGSIQSTLECQVLGRVSALIVAVTHGGA